MLLPDKSLQTDKPTMRGLKGTVSMPCIADLHPIILETPPRLYVFDPTVGGPSSTPKSPLGSEFSRDEIDDDNSPLLPKLKADNDPDAGDKDDIFWTSTRPKLTLSIPSAPASAENSSTPLTPDQAATAKFFSKWEDDRTFTEKFPKLVQEHNKAIRHLKQRSLSTASSLASISIDLHVAIASTKALPAPPSLDEVRHIKRERRNTIKTNRKEAVAALVQYTRMRESFLPEVRGLGQIRAITGLEEGTVRKALVDGM